MSGLNSGYIGFQIEQTSSNKHGRSLTKSSFDSFLSEARIRWIAECNLDSVPNSPGEIRHSSRTTASIVFSVDSRTTIDLDYFAIDRSNEHSASNILDIYTLGSDGREYHFQSSTTTNEIGHERLTIDPGVYTIYSKTTLNRFNSSLNGPSAYMSGFTLSIVPAPSTLALLTPAALFSTRRRR